MTSTNTKISVEAGKAISDTLTGNRDRIKQEVMAHETSPEAIAMMVEDGFNGIRERLHREAMNAPPSKEMLALMALRHGKPEDQK